MLVINAPKTHEINKEIKPRGRNMLNLKEKDIPAAREIAERVLADCISA